MRKNEECKEKINVAIVLPCGRIKSTRTFKKFIYMKVYEIVEMILE
jgi:hypothetical protein